MAISETRKGLGLLWAKSKRNKEILWMGRLFSVQGDGK